MTFITVKNTKKTEISIFDILEGKFDNNEVIEQNDESYTRTFKVETIKEAVKEKANINYILLTLKLFNKKYEHLKNQNREDLYNEFFIPKHSGGIRTIDEPKEELKSALNELKDIFENKFRVLPHTSAHAYIKNRCTITAMKKHQANNSNWFAKFDFKNFFGSTNTDFIINMLSIIFPFSEVVKLPNGKEELTKTIELCTLKDCLPQGSPMSPMLTNIMMVPIDYEISKTLRNAKVDRENKEEEIKSSFVYTRYADDIQISNRKDFNIKQVEELINQILKNYNAPFRINNKKTRYGSKSGRNWNLGLMLNKDNQLTIGHKRKRQLKAMMNNYLVDRNKNVKWSVEDLMILQGQISYAKQIEKEMIEYIISKTNEKHNSDIINMIKQDIKEQNK